MERRADVRITSSANETFHSPDFKISGRVHNRSGNQGNHRDGRPQCRAGGRQPGMQSVCTQDMYPTFLQRDWGFTPTRRAALTAFSMVGALTGGVLCGLYSDRLGRRRTIVLALVGAVAAIPLWAFAPSLPLLVAGAFVMQFFVQGAWGVIPAHITELAPDSVRGFLPGFAYQCGVLLAS